MAELQLPVNVLELPHFRVNYRPESFDSNRITDIGDCYRIVEANRVHLRGWDFPHLSNRDQEMGVGDNWVASWVSWSHHIEYWRFYLSTQFLYLGSIREIANSEWATQLLKTMRGHLRGEDAEALEKTKGFLSITNLVYTVTEYFEFAARLTQSGIYEENLHVSVGLRNVKSFMLAADWGRAWHSAYSVSQDEFTFTKVYTPEELVANAPANAIDAILWILQRFGWLHPNVQSLKGDQQKFLARRL